MFSITYGPPEFHSHGDLEPQTMLNKQHILTKQDTV